MQYNKEHNITPKTIVKEIRDVIEPLKVEENTERYDSLEEAIKANTNDIQALINKYEEEMKQAAKDLQFERAGELRDMIFKLKKKLK